MTTLDQHLCPRCGETKPVAQFAGRKNRQGLPYRSSYCRACQSVYNREWRAKNADEQSVKRRQKYLTDPAFRAAIKEASARRYAANPDAQRNNRLLNDFGITLAEYREMHRSQLGLCGICNEPCKSGRDLAVDHDHVTGKVRALLCIRCNNGLGNFRDDPALLAVALEYLAKYR